MSAVFIVQHKYTYSDVTDMLSLRGRITRMTTSTFQQQTQ